MKTINDLLVDLLIVAKEKPVSLESSTGICGIIDRAWYKEREYTVREDGPSSVIRKYFKTWPHFSGDVVYPVYDIDALGSPEDQYDQPSSHWEGRQLELRVSLLEHLIEATK